MGKKKVTMMALKVNLQCCKCYKKVKEMLSKFPQIQDQVYDKKNNKVIIKVVCCSPEKIRDKLRCTGDGAIKCIKILEPEKPTPPEKPGNPPKPSPPPPPPPPILCYPAFRYPVRDCCSDCHEGRGGGPCGRPLCESWGGGQMRYYDGYCGRPVYDSWGGGGDYWVYRSRCTDYICEENPNAACTIM